MADHILRAEPVIAVLTPYVLARSAHDAYCMTRDYVGDKSGWLMRLYMFCVTIELGMKGAILAENCTAAVKAELKSRKIGHDLSKLHDKFLEIFPPIFNQVQVEAIERINAYFRDKGLEYFTPTVMEQTLNGGRDIPSVDVMEEIAGKLDAFLKSHAYFIEGRTTDAPGVGIIQFV
ncbi:MAG: hypothetical protein QOG72_3128 [Sphingomonadales bacterium]|jgi:hypothetical protein|nr:hypothetical protein [Sphingomonadales bacterium]